MSRTQPDLKKVKVFRSGMGVCVCVHEGVTGNHMSVDSIISHSPTGPSVGSESSLLSRTR